MQACPQTFHEIKGKNTFRYLKGNHTYLHLNDCGLIWS